MKQSFKLSIFCSMNNKIISLRLRAKPSGDIKDVRYLWKHASKKPKTVVMDKGYDAEWMHRFFYFNNVKSIIPPRKGAKNGFCRKKLLHKFPQKTYNKRSKAESIMSALKQKFGASISSKHIGPARTDMYCRAILHNIKAIIQETWDTARTNEIFINTHTLFF